MTHIHSTFTVLFEAPFWVGVYERQWNDRYEVCKITFGREPKDCEVYEFLLKNWCRLRFSHPTQNTFPATKKENPKKMQRSIHRQVLPSGMGTKAQQALKLQQEQCKQSRRQTTKLHKEAEKERMFTIRQQKKKEKKKGH